MRALLATQMFPVVASAVPLYLLLDALGLLDKTNAAPSRTEVGTEGAHTDWGASGPEACSRSTTKDGTENTCALGAANVIYQAVVSGSDVVVRRRTENLGEPEREVTRIKLAR